MLQAANILLHTAHLSGSKQISDLFDMITINGAKTLNMEEDYGIELGKQADLIVLDAKNEKEAIRLNSECLYVIRKGKVLVETKPAVRNLKLGDREYQVNFKI